MDSLGFKEFTLWSYLHAHRLHRIYCKKAYFFGIPIDWLCRHKHSRSALLNSAAQSERPADTAGGPRDAELNGAVLDPLICVQTLNDVRFARLPGASRLPRAGRCLIFVSPCLYYSATSAEQSSSGPLWRSKGGSFSFKQVWYLYKI